MVVLHMTGLHDFLDIVAGHEILTWWKDRIFALFLSHPPPSLQCWMEQLLLTGLPDASFGHCPHHQLHPPILLLSFKVQVYPLLQLYLHTV